MIQEVTWEYNNAEEKGLKIFLASYGNIEITDKEEENILFSIYDDGSDAVSKVQAFIDEY